MALKAMSREIHEAQELEALERALHRPEVRRSAAAMAPYLADCFVEIGRSGRAYDKAQTLEAVGSEPEGAKIDASNFGFRRIAEGVVLVTYFTRSQGGSALRSSIWRKVGKRWEIVFHQGTPSADSGDR